MKAIILALFATILAEQTPNITFLATIAAETFAIVAVAAATAPAATGDAAVAAASYALAVASSEFNVVISALIFCSYASFFLRSIY